MLHHPPDQASGNPLISATSQVSGLADKLNAMIHQDSTAYLCDNYLSPEFRGKEAWQQDESSRAASPRCSADFPSFDEEVRRPSHVQPEWREKMAEWSYQIVDFFHYDREVVAISLSFLDRYAASCAVPVTMRDFQLFAVTSLFLASKLHPGVNNDGVLQAGLSLSQLAGLSRGHFSEANIKSMELNFLKKLAWRVHPPTALAFMRQLVLLLPTEAHVTLEARFCLEEATKFLIELSILDGTLVPFKRSSIALAALLTALEELRIPDKAMQTFLENVCYIAKLNPDSRDVTECREKLKEMFSASGFGNWAQRDIFQQAS